MRLRVVSSNIRFETPEDGGHAWGRRKGLLAEAINGFGPHLLGTQEGRRGQLAQLGGLLPGLAMCAGHRDWIEERMYPTIFHDPRALGVLGSGDVWLSETPGEAGSSSFGSAHPRLFTWARLAPAGGGPAVLHVNTHLDHLSAPAREAQARVLVREAAGLGRGGDLLVVTGDFNEPPGGAVRRTLLGGLPGLRDPWEDLGLAEEGSHHRFDGENAGNGRIDWILADRRLAAEDVRLDKGSRGGLWPSDHFPVLGAFSLGAEA